MANRKLIILFLVSVVCTITDAQKQLPADSVKPVRLLDINPRYYPAGKEAQVVISGICKPLKRTLYRTGDDRLAGKSSRSAAIHIHGDIQYDFLYRSLVDTPFYQKDFRQHSIRAGFNVVVKNRFPFRVTLLARTTNSPYFGNMADVNIQYSQTALFNQVKSNLKTQAAAMFTRDYQLRIDQTERLYLNKEAELQALQQWLTSPERLTDRVEEQESMAREQMPALPGGIAGNSEEVLAKVSSGSVPAVPGSAAGISLPDEPSLRKALENKLQHKADALTDSLLSRLDQWMQEKRLGEKKDKDSLRTTTYYHKQLKKFEALKAEWKQLQQGLSRLKKNLRDSLQIINREIASLPDASSIENYARSQKLSLEQMPRNWKLVSAVRNIGIGRGWVDYSELTVKNVSLTGVNLEVNPGKFYAAVAAGKINYRFRDFVLRHDQQPPQHLWLLRTGLGRKNGNNFIVTWYSGKRSLLNPVTNAPGAALSTNPEKVMGMAAEATWLLNPDQSVTLELAKSSFHTASLASQNDQVLMNKVVNFKDRSNEAVHIKVSSNWPQAAFRLTGYYRKAGAHFQSFNLQPVNSRQEAYQVKLQKHFWKKKLMAEAGIRKNDFSNPFITPGMSSETVFRFAQLSLRIPKYPFLSVGYYPSSQLTVLDNNSIAENQYNTLSAVMSYAYRVKQLNMSSHAVYTKFYNSSSDTGFIYYNASALTLTQFVFLGKFQLESGFTKALQSGLNITTLQQTLTWQLKPWLSAGGGLKYNKVRDAGIQWGSNAVLSVQVPGLGMIQMSYDKSYLPGQSLNLLPVETGRVGFTRVF